MKISLDENQQLAVESTSTRLVIVAPAGSGKTRVMVARIAKLLADGVPESRILPITFTRKAAQELTDRIRSDTGAFIRAFTIHSFAYNLILHQYAPRIGYRRPISIYDEHLSAEIYADIMIALGIRKENIRHIQAKKIIRIVNDLQEKDADSWVKVDEMYQKRLKAFNAVDYDLMIDLAIRILRESDFARLSIQGQYHHILIDEFQDTDKYQMEMIDLINPENLCAVGDYDQSIYQFRGAYPENIIEVARRGDVVNLKTNYRSGTNIIDASNVLISNNPSDLRKTAEATWDAETGKIVVQNVQSPEYQTALITKELLLSHKPQQISILCRTNRLVREVSANLEFLKIPHRAISREQDFWELATVRGVIYNLMLLQNPSDIAAWSKAVDFPNRKLTPDIRAAIKLMSVVERKKILTATSDINIPEVSQWADTLREIHDECDRTGDWTARSVLELCCSLMGWFEYYEKLTPGAKGNTSFKFAIARMLMQVSDLEKAGFDGLEHLLEWYAGRELQDEIKNSLPLVQVSTIHAFKGLENDIIILPDWSHGSFPNLKSDVEEERRLAYVALTRAREELYIIYRDDPSRFVGESGLLDGDDDASEDFIK